MNAERAAVAAKVSYPILLLLSLGHLLIDTHPGALPVLLPVLKEAYGLSYAAVTALVLVSQISSSVVQPVFGLLSDRLATRWLIPASLLLAAGGYLAILVDRSYAAALAGVFLMGLGVAAYHPEASKLAHYASGSEKAAWAMSVFTLGGNVGLAIGPVLMGSFLLLGGTAGVAGFALLAAPAAWLFARQVPALYARVPQRAAAAPAPEQARPGGGAAALTALLAVVVLRAWTHTSMITLLPLYYVTHLGRSPQEASAALTLYLAAGALGSLAGGWAADRFGRREVISLTLLLAVPLTWLFSHTTGLWTYLVLALGGAMLVSTYGVTTVFGQELLPHRVGLASGLTLGLGVGTGGIGATLLGLVADRWGLTVAVQAISLMPLAGVLAAWLLPRTGAAGAGTARPVRPPSS